MDYSRAVIHLVHLQNSKPSLDKDSPLLDLCKILTGIKSCEISVMGWIFSLADFGLSPPPSSQLISPYVLITCSEGGEDIWEIRSFEEVCII